VGTALDWLKIHIKKTKRQTQRIGDQLDAESAAIVKNRQGHWMNMTT